MWFRRFGGEQCCHKLTRLLEPEDAGNVGNDSPKDTAPHSRRWLCTLYLCCSFTYMLLALFSYAVSTDVVIICNGRFRNDYRCRIYSRICKGFAGSGCGLLHGIVSQCSSRDCKMTQNGQASHFTSGRVGVGLRTLSVRHLASLL